MDSARQQLFRRIDAMIRGAEGDDTFEALALEVFRYQFSANEPYRGYCLEKGVTTDKVTSWTDIPAFPSEAFKKQIVTSFPSEKAVMANITGGTGDPELRGIIFRDKMGKDLVLAANREVMSRYVFPEGERMPVLVLGPSPKTAPSMGMAIGMSETIREFGTDESGFFITRRGFLVKELVRTIRKVAETGKPLAIIGATSAFVFLFNACRQHGLRLPLPKGSRIVDGGGYRGRFGDCGRDDYYRLCADVFNVPESHCINVLGMAENATNYVDNMLRKSFLGERDDRIKHDLPWTRVVAMDLETCSRILPEGEVGLLRHFDLANLPTVLAVQTENLGVRTPHGFEIIGRAHVVDGKVTELPSEDPVGPMGDKKIFRYLDAYLKFSVNRQIKRISKDEYQCTCGEIIEDMVERQ